MDNATCKTVLSAYRAGSGDERDPAFAEALREIANDPELAAWFEEEQRFDARMVATLKAVDAPAGLKEQLLSAPAPTPVREITAPATPAGWPRRIAPWLAMAAVFVVAFVLGRLTIPSAAESRPVVAATGGNRLALQAIAYTGRMPALKFVCFDAAAVAQWVDKKSVALNMGKLIEKPMESMQMIGSSTTEWDGKPVVMVALQNGEQMAMLYFVRAADFPDAVDAADQVMEKDGYAAKTVRSGDCVYVLATKGTRKNLDFPLPR